MTKPIEVGKFYWLDLETVRVKVMAIEPLSSGLWWRCADHLGTEVTVPAADFREECHPDDDGKAD